MAKKANEDCTEYTYFCNGKAYHIFDGKDGVTKEFILILKELDHREYLQNRYADENRDFNFEFLKEVFTSDGRAIDPIDSISDTTYSPESILFPEEKVKTRKDIIEELISFITPDQERLYRYLSMGLKAREIAEIFNTSEDAIKKRKRKLIARFQRLIKEKYPEWLPFSGNRQELSEASEVSRLSDDESVTEGGNL